MSRIHIFQRTAEEVAASDEDMVYEYLKRYEFRLATMCNKVREKMLDTMIEENGITGGWYWMDSADEFPMGPFETYQEAKVDSQDQN